MQWVGIDKVKKADGTTLEMGDALVSLSTGTILDGSVTTAKLAAGAVTNAKLASGAVTESVTAAGTFTTASLNASAAIVGTQLANNTITATQIANATLTHTQLAAAAAITGSQLSATAAITGSQLAAAAAIAGTQLAANAAIAGSQLSSTAGITGGQLATGVKGNIIGPFPIVQNGLTSTKDVITGIPLGFIGSVVGVYGIYTAAAGSSLGVGTLSFTLSTAGIVQSAGPATVTLPLSHTATLNTVVAQSAAPTLQNTFVAADTFKISYTQTTAFTSDTGVLWVYLITN
jgi:hypothetical protein